MASGKSCQEAFQLVRPRELTPIGDEDDVWAFCGSQLGFLLDTAVSREETEHTKAGVLGLGVLRGATGLMEVR